MNKIFVAILAVLPVFTLLHAQDAKALLESGDYLLVYQTSEAEGMQSIKVSFTKGADGKLMLSCPGTNYLPTTVIQAQGIFQFGFTVPGPGDESGGTAKPSAQVVWYFVGHPPISSVDQHTYATGKVTEFYAPIFPRGGDRVAGDGTFLLSKLPQ